MPKATYSQLDLTGQRFGWLTVVCKVKRPGQGNTTYWLCKCDCGNETTVRPGCLFKNTKSCGCYLKTITANRSTTHGLRHTPEYHTWLDIKQRCTNPKNKEYFRYGGQGIAVCQRWLDSFQQFYTDMGPKPSSKHSIDRIDCAGPYSPENCRWATAREQRLNTSRTEWVTINGITKCLQEWCDDLGISRSTVYYRTSKGWSLVDALTVPRRGKKGNSGPYLPDNPWVKTPENPYPYGIHNHVIEYKGKSLSVAQWARELNVNYRTLQGRIERGWTLEMVFETPFRKPRKPEGS